MLRLSAPREAMVLIDGMSSSRTWGLPSLSTLWTEAFSPRPVKQEDCALAARPPVRASASAIVATFMESPLFVLSGEPVYRSAWRTAPPDAAHQLHHRLDDAAPIARAIDANRPRVTPGVAPR